MFEALEAHYRTLVRYLNLEDCGMVLGKDCGTLSMTQRSQYPEQAYKLGKSLTGQAAGASGVRQVNCVK